MTVKTKRTGPKAGKRKGKATVPPAQKPAYEALPLKLVQPPDVDDGLTQPQRRFLAAYRACGNLTHAAEMAGVTRQLHYDALKDSGAYRAAFAAAQVESVELLEAEARRRAMAGSDTLLIFLLKAARPDVYRDLHRYVDGRIVHEGKIDHKHSAGLTPQEREEKFRELLSRVVARVPRLGYTPVTEHSAAENGDGHEADGAGGADR